MRALASIILFLFMTAYSLAQNNEHKTWDKSKKNTKELNDLLKNPLELQAFKKLKPGRSNSGGGGKNTYHYKPAYNGFYYRYFIFGGRPGGLHITTYKKGKDIGGYMDSSEALIEVYSDKPDKDLGKADLCGLTKKEAIQKFGDNYLSGNGLLFYQYQNTLLILYPGPSLKPWFKIVKCKKSFANLEEILAEKELLEPYGNL